MKLKDIIKRAFEDKKHNVTLKQTDRKPQRKEIDMEWYYEMLY